MKKLQHIHSYSFSFFLSTFLLLFIFSFSADIAAQATHIYHASTNIDQINSTEIGTSNQTLITNASNPSALAVDLTAGKIYYNHPGNGLKRMNLDGTGQEDVSTSTGAATDIELDLNGGKVYWTTWPTYDLKRANLDGSGEEIIHDVNTISVTGNLAVDPIEGKIYWAVGITFYRSNLDGSSVETLFFDNTLGNVTGIKVDGAAGKLYWSNRSSGYEGVYRSNIDGSDLETLANPGIVNHPLDIDLDLAAGKVYYSDGGTNFNKLRQMNLDGSNNIAFGNTNYPGGISVGAVAVEAVPTMGEWALIIFGLIILSLGVVTLIRWQKEKQILIAN